MDKKLVVHGIEIREQIYQFIIKYISDVGYAPSVKEIGEAVGLNSISNVHRHLKNLENEGLIKIKPYTPRAIKVVGYEFKKIS